MTGSPADHGVRVVPPSASAREAACAMASAHVGFLVVVEDERPLGMLTDRDVTLGVLAARLDAATCRVAELMTTPVVTVLEGTGSAAASRTMREHAVRKLPIVDEQGRLVGVHTADDVILSISRHVHDLARTMHRALENENHSDPGCSAVFGSE